MALGILTSHILTASSCKASKQLSLKPPTVTPESGVQNTDIFLDMHFCEDVLSRTSSQKCISRNWAYTVKI